MGAAPAYGTTHAEDDVAEQRLNFGDSDSFLTGRVLASVLGTPVGISIHAVVGRKGNGGRDGGPPLNEAYASIKGALKVSQDAFGGFVVSVTGIVGVGGEERDGRGDVGASVTLEPKETANETLVLGD